MNLDYYPKLFFHKYYFDNIKVLYICSTKRISLILVVFGVFLKKNELSICILQYSTG